VHLTSADQAVALLEALPVTTPRIVVSGNFAAPMVLVDVVDKALESYRLFVLNGLIGLPDRDGVVLETPFVGGGVRRSPRLRYIPSRLSMVPLLFGESHVPDVVLLHTSAPFRGTVSMGMEVNILPAAVEAVRRRGGLVIAQANRRMPYTFGDGVLPLEMVDFVLEVDEPLPTTRVGAADDVSRQIGERVAGLVPQGATLQLGIGAVPDATLGALTEHRGLRVWSEMISDGVLELERYGALDRGQPIVSSFLFGTEELYSWVDRNPRIRVLRTETVNDPATIAAQPGMTSVNTALQVDLYGQANASRVAGRIYSGFGGQTDFIIGAMHARAGQALMALRSWHPKADVSSVVPLLEEPVTSFQQSAIVTENGVARLWGASDREQAESIIENAAHPRIRAELREEAHALGLL
jgi:acyl-CoA hydrolase